MGKLETMTQNTLYYRGKKAKNIMHKCMCDDLCVVVNTKDRNEMLWLIFDLLVKKYIFACLTPGACRSTHVYVYMNT